MYIAFSGERGRFTLVLMGEVKDVREEGYGLPGDPEMCVLFSVGRGRLYRLACVFMFVWEDSVFLIFLFSLGFLSFVSFW